MASEKPTLIFVHGAFHGPACFKELSHILQDAGYKCVDNISLPGSGGTPSNTLEDDVKVVREAILKVIDEEKHDCIIVTHSYGAIVATEAIEGLTKEDRKEKLGVLKLVYLAPNLPKEGESWQTQLMPFFESIGVEFPPVVDFQEGMMVFTGQDPEFFYNCIEPDVQQTLMKQIKTQAPGCPTTPVKYAGWKHIPGWFFLGTRDNGLIPPFEEMIINQPGLRKEVVEWIEAGHTMFVSHAQQTADFIIRAAEDRK